MPFLKFSIVASKRISAFFDPSGLVVFAIAFLLSFVISPYHVNGDQEYYNKAFLAAKGFGFFDFIPVYQSIVFTAEYPHAFILWIVSYLGLAKVFFMSLANGFLAFLFAKLLRAKGYSYTLVFCIIFSSFYTYTLFFTLERLKFAFIFLFLFLLTSRKIFLFFAPLAHLSLIIPVFAAMQSRLLADALPRLFSRLFLGKTYVYSGLIFLSLGSLVSGLFYQHIVDKQYLYTLESVEPTRILLYILSFGLFLAIALICSSNKLEICIFFAILFLPAAMFDAQRFNMFAYFGFLFYSNPVKHINNSFVLLLCSYLGFRSINYFHIIVTQGG